MLWLEEQVEDGYAVMGNSFPNIKNRATIYKAHIRNMMGCFHLLCREEAQHHQKLQQA